MSRSRKEANILATAANTSLQSQTLGFAAAAMRGAGREELDALRQKAHDTLDALLDLNAEYGAVVRTETLG